MNLSEELQWRGLVKDKTFSNSNWLDKPRKFYLGIDAGSADSLTVGNLAIVLLARRLADAGWQAYLVMGGGTSLVGDPGGKAEERQLISREAVRNNIAGIKKQVTSLFSGENFTMVDNHDWLAELKYLEFLRAIGKHFSMTELMQRDFVSERMGEGGSGISYTEFSYSLVQGYDFWHLFKVHEVVMQIGGSDQWGNMLSGSALIRKKEGQEAHALSMPLVINKSTGVKFGKSEGGAIWLDPDKTTPNQFYQFWVNTDDADVEDYLKIFTFLPKKDIEEIITKHREHPEARMAQATLAEEITELVHGKGGLAAAKGSRSLLVNVDDLLQADEKILAELKKQLPHLNAKPGDSIIEKLADSGLASSNSEARRLIVSRGIYLNNQVVDKENFDDSDFQNGRLLLRRGKTFKNSVLVELDK